MILTSGVIRLIQELRAKNAAQQLERLIHESITVRRAGDLQEIAAQGGNCCPDSFQGAQGLIFLLSGFDFDGLCEGKRIDLLGYLCEEGEKRER